MIYTYCLTRSAPARNIRGINGRKVYGISTGQLCAVVSKVPKKDFGKNQLVENLKDPAWAEKKLRRHAEVTGKVMEEQTVLPLKFGTIFKSQGSIKAMLAANRQQFLSLLSKFSAKQEWGIKIYADLAKLGDFVLSSNDEIKKLKKKVQSCPRGRSYLLQKKLEESLKKKTEQEAMGLAQKVFDTLTRQSQESQLSKLLPKKLTGKEEEMILNSVHLVDRKNFNKFKKSLNETIKKFETLGLAGELSGPWPPYSFVS